MGGGGGGADTEQLKQFSLDLKMASTEDKNTPRINEKNKTFKEEEMERTPCEKRIVNEDRRYRQLLTSVIFLLLTHLEKQDRLTLFEG